MTGAARPARTATRGSYVFTEGVLSVVINTVLSLAFFLALFGTESSVPVRIGGAGGYAFDLLPQSVMIVLMSTLVPGAITAGRIRRGRIGGLPEARARLAVRSLLTALAGLAIGAAIAVALVTIAGDIHIPWTAALVVKLVYGAALAAVATPIGLRAALRQADLH